MWQLMEKDDGEVVPIPRDTEFLLLATMTAESASSVRAGDLSPALYNRFCVIFMTDIGLPVMGEPADTAAGAVSTWLLFLGNCVCVSLRALMRPFPNPPRPPHLIRPPSACAPPTQPTLPPHRTNPVCCVAPLFHPQAGFCVRACVSRVNGCLPACDAVVLLPAFVRPPRTHNAPVFRPSHFYPQPVD